MLENPFLYSLAITLVHFIWQGCLVALVLKVLLTFLSTQKAQLRYAFSTMAMLINLILPIVTFFVVYHADFEQLTNNHAMIATFVYGMNSPADTDFSSNFVEYLPFISILWLASISYLSIKLVFDIHFANKLTKVGLIQTEKPLATRFTQLAQDLELPIMPRLLISLKAEIPMAIGWLKPVVLLPASMISGLSGAQLEMLILHELAHIKRHDYLVNFIQTVVEILLFFHPAVRWVSTQMRNEREFCSDDIAVHHCCKPIAYARTLTETAALCHKHKINGGHSIPQMALAASGGDLKERVVRLVDSHCTHNNDLGKWFAGVFLVLSLLLISTRQFFTLPLLDQNFTYLPFSPQKPPSLTQRINNENIIDLSQTPIAQHLLDENSELNKVDRINELVNEDLFLKNKTAFTQIRIPKPANTSNTVDKKSDLSESSNKHSILETKIVNPIDTINPESIKIKQISFSRKIKNQNIDKSLTEYNPIDEGRLKSTKTNKIKQDKITVITENKHINTDVLEQFKTPANPYAKQLTELALEPKSEPAHSASTINTVSKTDKLKVTRESARLITSLAPKYPAIAKRKKLESEILVHFNVDRNGYVKNIEFAQQSKASYFRRSIRVALRKWHFEPAKVNGKVVESTMSKIFSFSLAD